MEDGRCSVCGRTDMKLMDGYYYCVECGTQDVNFRETIVEQTIFDGSAALTVKRKIHEAKETEMSKEWCKWHAYNFMLSGLANEVLALGADPDFKMQLLWIWSRYVKYYQEKDQNVKEQTAKGIYFYESSHSDFEEEECNNEAIKKKYNKMYKTHPLNLPVLLSMIVIALNIVNSDILISDLLRFKAEKRLSSTSSLKYIPKAIKFNKTDWYINYQNSRVRHLFKNGLGMFSINLFDRLDIKTHWIPDLKKIVKRFVIELCLPNDFKLLVYSLMKAIPYRVLHNLAWNGKRRMPDYEGLVAAFVMVALKICFGLDDDYEIKLSEAVSKVNEAHNYAKAYKFDMYSDNTGRLFSFDEWLTYLQFRELILRQYNLNISDYDTGNHTEDYLFLTQKKIEARPDVPEPNVNDQITWEFVQKLATVNPELEKYKNDFPVTLTPLSTYTDIIASKADDPDLRLLLCEDFTKYSLKYAAIDFELKGSEDVNVVKGVNEIDKICIDDLTWDCELINYEIDLVYVKDCHSKYWMTSNVHQTKHFTEYEDHGYNSNEDSVSMDTKPCNESNIKEEGDILEDDSTGNIFDDNFYGFDDGGFNDEYNSFFNIEDDKDIPLIPSASFNRDDTLKEPSADLIDESVPATFNRDDAIKELVTNVCKKYKIFLPKEYTTPSVAQKRRKRNSKEAGEVKRRKTTKDEKTDAQTEINEIIEMYQNKILIVDQPNNGSPDMSLEVGNEIQEEISAINTSEYVNHDLTDNLDQNQYNIGVNDVKETELKIDNTKFGEEDDEKQLLLKLACLDDDPEFEKLLAKALDDNQDIVEEQAIKCKQTTKTLKNPERVNSEKLITNRSLINFGYWCRHYPGDKLKQQQDCTITFIKELLRNYPKSFHFLLGCCSIVSRTTMLNIYTIITRLERYVSSKSPLIKSESRTMRQYYFDRQSKKFE